MGVGLQYLLTDILGLGQPAGILMVQSKAHGVLDVGGMTRGL
jgi:hypothetical protein